MLRRLTSITLATLLLLPASVALSASPSPSAAPAPSSSPSPERIAFEKLDADLAVARGAVGEALAVYAQTSDPLDLQALEIAIENYITILDTTGPLPCYQEYWANFRGAGSLLALSLLAKRSGNSEVDAIAFQASSYMLALGYDAMQRVTC